jgi:AcrR family transcriptional regulator
VVQKYLQPIQTCLFDLENTDLSGRVKPMNATKQSSVPRATARERLLAAADELFYENGVNTVGIDRVIEHAGVAKASLYDCFGSKDELIRAYLEARSAARQARVNEWISRYDTPQKKLLGIFELLGEVSAQPGYKGCAFTRARADDNASDKVKGACDQSRAAMLGRFTSLAREAAAADPERLGQQLLLLYDGASVAAHLDCNRNAATLAREVAAQMLSSACPKDPAQKKKGASRS